jgi:hypothetical protein
MSEQGADIWGGKKEKVKKRRGSRQLIMHVAILNPVPSGTQQC